MCRRSAGGAVGEFCERGVEAALAVRSGVVLALGRVEIDAAENDVSGAGAGVAAHGLREEGFVPLKM